MTAADFRRIALSFEGAEEGSHMGAADFRVGGRYRLECVTGEGNSFALEGEYREIRAPERLVYSWIWQQGGMAGFETVVTLDLVALGPAETELRLHHELFPDTT